MHIKRIIGFLLLGGWLSFQCTNNPPKAPQPSPAENTVSPPGNSTEPTINQSPTGKDLEALRNDKVRRIDSVSSRTDAAYFQKPDKPPLEIKVEKAKTSAGPTAYVNKKNIALQSAPDTKAAKTGALKIYEQVIILETKMTDEQGKTLSVPTWYRVQREDKKEGWVIANAVTLN